MKYTNQQIRENLLWFVEDTNQHELWCVIPFCIGYYGSLTKQIWNVIIQLHVEGVIEF